MKNIKAIVIGLLLTFAAPLAAFAQCSGQAPSQTYCGNPTVSTALPGWEPMSGFATDLDVGVTTITGGTDGAPLKNNAGILGNGAITAAWVSFTQNGVGATLAYLWDILINNVYYPEFYGGGCSATGATNSTAIQNAVTAAGAISSGPGTVRLKNCIYNTTVGVVSTKGVRLVGENAKGTFISFSPASGGQVAYKVSNTPAGPPCPSACIVSGGSIENVYFYTNDLLYPKTAIELVDVSGFKLENVRIGGNTTGIAAFWGDNSHASVGLVIKGREFIDTADVQIAADIPFQLSKNPNSIIDNDQGDYNGLHLTATPTNHVFIVDDALSITRNTWTNLHMAGGVDCVRWINTTGTLPSDGNSFIGWACEQGDSAAGYNYNIHGNALGGLIRATTLGGTQVWDNVRNGMSLRYIRKMPIMGSVFYQGVAPLECLDTNNTVYGLNWTNSLFQSCSTASFGGMELNNGAALEGGTVLPNWAYYSSALDGNALNVGRALTMPSGASNIITVLAQGTAFSPVLQWPNTSGTLVASATLPLLASSTTGAVSFGPIAANTVWTNATASSAVPTAFAMPSCSTAASALNWTSGSGFGCNSSITAATSPNVTTTATTTNASFYPLFVASSANSSQVVNLDASGLSYNPSTNILSVNNATLASTGILSWGTANIQGANSGASMNLTAALTNVTSGIGFLYQPTLNISSAISMFGRRMTVTGAVTGSSSALYGDYVVFDNDIRSGSTLTNSIGYAIGQRLATGDTNASNVLTNMTAFNILQSAIGTFTGSSVLAVTNLYGMKIDNQGAICATAGVTCGASYGLYIGAQSNADAAAKALYVADTTDATSITTGSVQTLGGLGVSKAAYFGTFASIGTKIRAAGTAPALTSCGGGSPAISGSDLAGEVTMGTTATGCVITFNVAYSSTPYCTVSWQATPLASQSYAVSTTAITLTQTSTSGNKVNYTCVARSGG